MRHLFATVMVALLVLAQGCVGMPDRRSCDEISLTTFALDVHLLTHEHAAAAREAAAIISRDLRTTIDIVQTCDDDTHDMCVPISYDRSYNNGHFLGVSSLAPNHIWLHPDRVPSTEDTIPFVVVIVAHEAVHVLRNDSWLASRGEPIHDPRPGRLMSARHPNQEVTRLTATDLAWICDGVSLPDARDLPDSVQ